MTIELGALNIPIRATGRDAVLEAFNEIDRAGAKAAQPVSIPVSTPGAAAAAKSFMELDAQAKRNAASYQNLQNQSRRTFDRIAHDVAQATADYRLGIIALEDYTVALEVARKEAAQVRSSVGGLSPEGLKSFNRVLDGISASSRSARRESRGLASDFSSTATVLTQRAGTAESGVRRMTSGIAQLAVTALGTRSAVGSLATGALISFGASAALTIGVTAGVALIAYAYDKLTESARKSEEQLKKTREELEKGSPQQLAAERVKIIQDAITKAERDVAKARQGTDVFDRATGGIRTVAPDPRAVQAAERELATLRRDLEKATAEAGKLDRAGTDESIAVLTKAIELRTASTFQIRQALALLPQLRAAAADETKTLAERNSAQEQANSLQGAFDKLAKQSAEGRQAAIDALRDEVGVLTETASQRALTTAETDRLRDAYVRVTAALEAKNTTDRQQLELLKAQRQALAELARQTSATFTTKGSTFGQNLNLGKPKTPALDQITFGSPALDTPESFFGGGALDSFTEGLDQQAARAGSRVKSALDGVQDQIDQSLDQLRTSLAEGITQSLTDGIAAGFEEGIASGSIGKGAAALTATLLSGLGSAAISFGVGSLGIAKLMTVIKKALESLNPAAAIPAALGMIALGGVLKGVASRMFGNSSGASTSPGGGSTAASTTTRIIVGRDGEVVNRTPAPVSRTVAATPTAAREAGKMEPQPTFIYSPVNIGIDNATAQRQVYEMLSLGAKRGLKIQTGRG